MDAQKNRDLDEAMSGSQISYARDARFDIKLDAPMQRENGDIEKICIENLSIWGLQATCPFPPKTGEAVLITIADLGEFEGVVRWQRDYRFGVHTFEKIDVQAIPAPTN